MSNNTQRYEVVAPMPHFTHLFKGDILVPKFHSLCDFCWGKEDEEDVHKWVTFCPDYPHLFRLLKWWEGLAIDELPKYVKWQGVNDTEYFKVKEWLFIKNDNPFEDGSLFTAVEIDDDGDEFCYDFVYNYDGEIYPATEAEYQDYITKLNGK
jgi:hypothetical protein